MRCCGAGTGRLKAALDHAWALDPAQAPALQQQLAARVERSDRHAPFHSVTGVDVAYAKDGDRLIAAAVTLDLATLGVIEQAVVEDRAQFPYLPGLFSFRELPPLARRWSNCNVHRKSSSATATAMHIRATSVLPAISACCSIFLRWAAARPC